MTTKQDGYASAAQSAQHPDEFLCPLCYDDLDNIKQKTQPQHPDDACPGCRKGCVCRTPKCGRLALPNDHPHRTGLPEKLNNPDWLKYDYASDVITIHGLGYQASMFGKDGFLALEGQLLRITRGPANTFALYIEEPSDQSKPAQQQEPVAIGKPEGGWKNATKPHNFGKPMGYALVTNANNRIPFMLDGGAHTFRSDAEKVLARPEYAQTHHIVELVSKNTSPPASKPLTDEQKDAARYRWLKARLMGANFDWNESGACALVFEWPKDVPVGADCDQNIDTAIEVAHGAKGSA